MTNYTKAIDAHKYMAAMTILMDTLEERAAKLEAVITSGQRLTGVQWRSINDAVNVVGDALSHVRLILANFEKKKNKPLSIDEVAAVMLVGHELGIAEGFISTVEMDWPEALERAAGQLDQRLLHATENLTPQ